MFILCAESFQLRSLLPLVLFTTGKHWYKGTHFPLTASRSFQVGTSPDIYITHLNIQVVSFLVAKIAFVDLDINVSLVNKYYLVIKLKAWLTSPKQKTCAQNPQKVLVRDWWTVDCEDELKGIGILQWLGLGIFFCSSVGHVRFAAWLY